MSKNQYNFLENILNPSKINTFHEESEIYSKSIYKNILIAVRNSIKNTDFTSKNQDLNHKNNNYSIEAIYFQTTLNLKIFILYGQIYFNFFFISLQVSTHYNLKHKCNLYIKVNREYLCRGYILH